MGFDLIVIPTNGENIDYDGYWTYNYSKLSDFFYIKRCFGLSVGEVIAIIDHRINLLKKNNFEVATEMVDDFGMIGDESIWDGDNPLRYCLLLRSLQKLSDDLKTLPYDAIFTEAGWVMEQEKGIMPYSVSDELKKNKM